MITIFIIFLAINIPLVFVSCFLDQKRRQEGKKKLFYYVWIGIVSICAIAALSLPLVNQSMAVGDAEEVAVFEDAKLYHDKDNDTYFTIHVNDWNVFDIIDKKDVPNDVAEAVLQDVYAESDLAKKNAKFYDDIK